jgi:nucleotide-binding universal stress UspA family protein
MDYLMDSSTELRHSAINDFYRARSQATLKELMAHITGKSIELLSYEDVRQKLRAQGGGERTLKEIPLAAIVGSVGRYADFTRDFLPLRDSDRDRWIQVQLATHGMTGLPPIDVYQIGEAYFVIDGNHRVSVARQLGAKHIQAYVTEVYSRVEFAPDIQPDELIIKSEMVNFLENTRLDELRPEMDFTVTTPGKYPLLEEHIHLHRYILGINQPQEPPFNEAVMDWADNIYLPVIESISKSGLLRYFPGRTETDLYLWISKYQQELESHLGFSVRAETALGNLSTTLDKEEAGILRRLRTKLRQLIIPKRFVAGPQAGQWRTEILAVRPIEYLFPEILVPIDGKETGWYALEQAAVIAQREKANLEGLHVVPWEEDLENPDVMGVQEEFTRRCEQVGIHGRLVVATGDITDEICRRAVWTDLVVTTMLHPPGPQPFDRLDSGFQKLIQRCPRPVLATPRQTSQLNRALLAYDGSPKADEGLYLSAYLAEQWKIPLSVVTVFKNGKIKPETLLKARVYLEESGIEAQYHAMEGEIVENILQIVASDKIDLIVTGGYGLSPVIQVVLGSTVDRLLRETSIPVLICR